MRKVLSILKNAVPFPAQMRAIKRALIPYRSNPANDGYLLEQAVTMIAEITESHGSVAGATVVEIGTGWVPIMPLTFRIAGADKVISLDQNRLLDRHTFNYACEFVGKNLGEAIAKAGVPPSLFHAHRIPQGAGSLSGLCQDAGVQYLAPYDFMDLPPKSADLIISRTVLEHIPEDILRAIFQHAKTVLRPGGVMCHIIDMSDHFEHKDKSLSRLDMLRYGDKEWRSKTRDPQDYQNRLRQFDYVRLLNETGWKILKMKGEPDPKALQDLKGMKIMPVYANVPHEELAILTSLIVATQAN